LSAEGRADEERSGDGSDGSSGHSVVEQIASPLKRDDGDPSAVSEDVSALESDASSTSAGEEGVGSNDDSVGMSNDE